MASRWRALRRRLLTPNTSATRLATRGFHEKSPAARELLEKIGGIFLTGYGYAAEERTPAAAEERLELIPAQFRGFAYEGAAMGLAVRDGLPLGGGGRFDRLLAGRGQDHIYMAYVGLGWAMARLPKFRWPDADELDPMLRWLVLDGYGFHQAYFRTDRYVHEQYQDPRFSWPHLDHPYANRAIDQGIGRCLWFVGGTDVDLIATMIGKFPEARRPDLYSGAGLAATYAGGVDEDELERFRRRAGEHRAQLAQGSAFAAEARVRAGLVVPHTHIATRVLCGLTPAEAAQVTRDVRPEPTEAHGRDGLAVPLTQVATQLFLGLTPPEAALVPRDGRPEPVDGDLPAYEVWRQRITAEFASRSISPSQSAARGGVRS